MRALLIGSLCAAAILSGFFACGKPPAPCTPDSLTNAPQACPDKGSLGFGREFGTATLLGTAPQETLTVRNGGVGDLIISSATLTGDSAFALSTEPSTFPATIAGNKYFYMRVIFTPTAAKLYTGRITVQSNAQNSPSQEFQVTGCGLPSDGGTSPCYRDGGR